MVFDQPLGDATAVPDFAMRQPAHARIDQLADRGVDDADPECGGGFALLTSFSIVNPHSWKIVVVWPRRN